MSRKLESILEHLLNSRRCIVTTHVRPDGDAVGSQMALGLFLRKIGKHATMISADPVPRNLEWMVEKKLIRVFSGSIKQRELIASADTIVIVDTNGLQRLGGLSGPVEQSSATKILIDHHPNPERWFDLSLVTQSASSTGELIFDLIELHDPSLIDRQIATALYTAIMTDTGSFQFNNVTPRVHRIIADLLEAGNLNPEPIHNRIYNSRSVGSLRLLGRALDTIRVAYGGKLGYMTVSERMVHEAGASFDEMEGLVNYVLAVDGVEAGVMFLETERGVKLSFRSQGNCSVTEWARYYGGGGHRNASGAYIEGKKLGEVLDEVIEVGGRFLPFKPPRRREPDWLSEEDARLLNLFKDR